MAVTTVQIAVLGDDGTVIGAIPAEGVSVADANAFIDDLAEYLGYDPSDLTAQRKAEHFLRYVMRQAVGAVHDKRRRDALLQADISLPDWGEQG